VPTTNIEIIHSVHAVKGSLRIMFSKSEFAIGVSWRLPAMDYNHAQLPPAAG
jgi:hypothetical protein